MAAAELSRQEIIRKPPRQVYHSIVTEQGSYQMDIAFARYADSPRYIAANGGMSCMLVAVDVATRYAYAEPMSGKDWSEVCRAFDVIWHAARAAHVSFHTVTTDDGSEFTNQHWQQLLRARGVRQFIKEPGDRFSLGVVDRVIRTIKTWLED